MTSAFEKLEKILRLEQDTGHYDRAVIGGLERFIPNWQAEVAAQFDDEKSKKLVEDIVERLQGYGAKTQPLRRSVIQDVLSLLAQDGPPRTRTDAQAVPTQRRTQPRTPEEITLDDPVDRISGVSTVYARRLRRLGVETIQDLLHLVPRRYDDFSHLKTISQLVYGEEVTIIGRVERAENRESRKGHTITTCTLRDPTGVIQATWFNQAFLLKSFKPGRQIVLSGRVDQYLGRLVFQVPEWEPLERELIHTGRIVPVYPLTQGLRARWLRKLMKRMVDQWAARVPDPVPNHVLKRETLLDLPTAIKQVHFPDSMPLMQQARRRLAFDEFLLIQLGVLRQRRQWQRLMGRAIRVDREFLQSFLDQLPFKLTQAQQRSLDEIVEDLQRTRPMSRLLQGDVGSGKTVVAAAAIVLTVADGFQAVIMAPTEILAEQHYKSISQLLEGVRIPRRSQEQGRAEEPGSQTALETIRIRLLTGSLTRSEKEQIHQEMATGQVDLIIGTHALIQEGVELQALGLAVIDEQHRFGVHQRASLRSKGFNPHVLVMSATPIPRTLGLTVYGDLDISVIDELPPGRQEIVTRWLMPAERERAYSFVRSQIEKGRQTFFICPLIEESDKVETKAAVAEHQRLQKHIFPDLRLGLLHGRMKAEEKEAVMDRFYRGELDILVSTSVVEVGIDVPNATVMVVEGADRFGLAQLHQFRGRVGRGEHQSYCLLLASETLTPEAEQRLKIIESTQDGFVLAEEDLKLRGPGEFFGTRQSGLPDLRVAKLSDVQILERARAEAMEIFRRDPDLSAPEHALLASKVAQFWRGEGDLS